jgi:hypothetical protein
MHNVREPRSRAPMLAPSEAAPAHETRDSLGRCAFAVERHDEQGRSTMVTRMRRDVPSGKVSSS